MKNNVLKIHSNRIINVLTLIGALFLFVCYFVYLFFGTAVSDSGGLFVSVTAILIAVLPIGMYPFLKKTKKILILRMIYCITLICYMIVFTFFCAVVIHNGNINSGIHEDEDIIVVCGCRTYGYTPSDRLKDRLDLAYSLLNDNPSAVCILSGGKGEDEGISEAESMRSYLVFKGVDEKRLIKEENSRDTVENIKYSIEAMKENEISPSDKVLLVTSDYHVPRVEMVAKEYGLDARVVGAQTSQTEYLFPALVREFMSYIRYFLFG